MTHMAAIAGLVYAPPARSCRRPRTDILSEGCRALQQPALEVLYPSNVDNASTSEYTLWYSRCIICSRQLGASQPSIYGARGRHLEGPKDSAA